MKVKLTGIVVSALLMMVPLAYAQDSGSEKKGAATEVKDASKTAAKSTEKGTQTATKDTEKAANKTVKGVKRGVKTIGHGV